MQIEERWTSRREADTEDPSNVVEDTLTQQTLDK